MCDCFTFSSKFFILMTDLTFCHHFERLFLNSIFTVTDQNIFYSWRINALKLKVVNDYYFLHHNPASEIFDLDLI